MVTYFGRQRPSSPNLPILILCQALYEILCVGELTYAKTCYANTTFTDLHGYKQKPRLITCCTQDHRSFLHHNVMKMTETMIGTRYILQ